MNQIRTTYLVSTLVFLALPAVCLGIYESTKKDADIQSAIMINQLALMQHSEILKEMMNDTKGDRCAAACDAEDFAGNLQALLSIKEAMVAFLEKSQLATRRSGCPFPYTEVVYECFYAHPKKLTWHQARMVCRGMGGDLAEPQNLYALQTYLADVFGPSYFWVGGTNHGTEDGSWQWISGRPVDENDWLFARPDNLGGDENCLEIVMSDYPKLFNDETCTVHQRFICQYRHS